MAGTADAFAAEQAAIAQYVQSQRGGRAKYVMGINVTPYAGARTPGIDATKMYGDPCCILRDADRRRASGKTYLWRKPDDTVTQSMVARGVLKAVLGEDVDKDSPYANVELKRIITSQGPRQVVRTPAGLGLFECPSSEALKEVDKGLVPDSAQARVDGNGRPIVRPWEASYLSELSEKQDAFSGDLESLSASSLQGRVSGTLDVKDTAREMVV
jgi:hypothetical protein